MRTETAPANAIVSNRRRSRVVMIGVGIFCVAAVTTLVAQLRLSPDGAASPEGARKGFTAALTTHNSGAVLRALPPGERHFLSPDGSITAADLQRLASIPADQIVTVKEGGGWHPSMLSTFASMGAGGPQDGRNAIKPRGADTPEIAVQQWLVAAHAHDLRRLLELSAPDETYVLHSFGEAILSRYNATPSATPNAPTNVLAMSLTSHRVDDRATVTSTDGTVKMTVVKRDGDWYVVPSRAFVNLAIAKTDKPDGAALFLAASAG